MVTTGNDAETGATREEIPHDHLFKVTGLSSTNLEKLAQGKYFNAFLVLFLPKFFMRKYRMNMDFICIKTFLGHVISILFYLAPTGIHNS